MALGYQIMDRRAFLRSSLAATGLCMVDSAYVFSQDTKDNKPQYKNKISFEKAKKSNDRKLRLEYLLGEMYEAGLLYDEKKSPQGHVGAWYDCADPRSQKKLFERLKAQARSEGQKEDYYTKAFELESAREFKIGLHTRDPPGQKIRDPFVGFYLDNVFTLSSEDELKSTFDELTALAEANDLGRVFQKDIPLKNGAVALYGRYQVIELYRNYARLTKILSETRNVSIRTKDDARQSYLEFYGKCHEVVKYYEHFNVQNATPEDLQKLTNQNAEKIVAMKEARDFTKECITTAEEGMRKLGYEHKFIEASKDETWDWDKYDLVKAPRSTQNEPSSKKE